MSSETKILEDFFYKKQICKTPEYTESINNRTYF